MERKLSISSAWAAPSPREVAAYLLHKGYRNRGTDDRWAIFAKDVDAGSVEVEVPQRSTAPDYARTVERLIADLARVENLAANELLRDLRSASLDVVRIRLEGGATRDGRIPVDAGARVFEASRELLLAAACAALRPQSAYANRKPREATELLQRARFGQTEVGSFVLTIESEVAPRLQERLQDGDLAPLVDADPDAPLERKASVALLSGLTGLGAAARESAATNQLEPFERRAQQGVSANLCDAVVELLDASAADSVRVGVSFAGCRPHRSVDPAQVVFTSDTISVLRDAAKQLRARSKVTDSEIIGTVVKLDRPSPELPGEVTVHGVIDGRRRSVRIALEREDYETALGAHRDGRWLSCVGDLVREGRGWCLRNPRELHIEADDEER
jgi:hypothetical protein